MKDKLIICILLFFVIIEISLCFIALTITPVKLKRNVFTFQYGDKISTNVEDYVIVNESLLDSLSLNIDNVSTEVGDYNASVSYNGKEYPFKIHIVDTVKPKAELKKVEWNIVVGEEISAKDLVTNVKDFSSTTIYFFDEDTNQKNETLSFLQEGTYIERIIVEDKHGNQSATLRVKIVVGLVDSKPSFEGVSNIIIRMGENIDLMAGVKAIDLEDGDITSAIKVTGSVDVNVPGNYYITYTVEDSKGNLQTVVRTINVE